MPTGIPASTGLNEHPSSDSKGGAAQEAQKGCPHVQNGTADNSAGSAPVLTEEWSPEEMAHTFVLPSPNVQCSNLDGESVLLHLDTGVHHALNQVGTVMWELFAPDRSLARVLSAMLEKYDVTEDLARADLNKLVTLLVNAKLVEIEKKEPVHHAV